MEFKEKVYKQSRISMSFCLLMKTEALCYPAVTIYHRREQSGIWPNITELTVTQWF